MNDKVAANYVDANAKVTRVNMYGQEEKSSLNQWISGHAATDPAGTTWHIQLPELPKAYGRYESLAIALQEIEGKSFTLRCERLQGPGMTKRWTPKQTSSEVFAGKTFHNASMCSMFLYKYNQVFSMMHMPAVELFPNRLYLDCKVCAMVSYVDGGVEESLSLPHWLNMVPGTTCTITFGTMPEGNFKPLEGKTFTLHDSLGAVSNWTCSALNPDDEGYNHLCADYICKYANTLGGTAVTGGPGSNVVAILMVHGGGAAAP